MNLSQLNKMACEELVADVRDHGGPSEFNRHHNRISRAKIRAMLKEYGSVFIWSCNPYGKEIVVREYTGGMVYNFDGSFITPEYDIDLEWMMRERLKAPYTGTSDDYDRITEIYDHAEKMGMVHLVWS